MALLSATFQADFSSFTTAVANAQAKMRTFEDDAKKVASSLSAMENSISGVNIVQAATVAAQAVENLGGVSKLTYAELQRLGGTAQEAVDKLRALGQDVPKGVQDLADRARGAAEELSRMNAKAPKDLKPVVDEGTKSLEGMKEAALNVATGFVAMSTAKKAWDFLREITDEARALEVLSAQTQISVTDLQTMGAAAHTFGVDAEQLGRGVFQLANRIAGGDQSVATGLAAMGLSMQHVSEVAHQPGGMMALFVEVETAAGKLHGQIRDTAMADIYGARLGASLAALANGFDEAMKRAGALNKLMDPEAVAAAAEWANSIDRLEKNFHSLAVNGVGPFLAGFNVMTETAMRGSFWATNKAMMQDWLATFISGEQHTEHLTTLIDHQNQALGSLADAYKGVSSAGSPLITLEEEIAQHESFIATLRASASVQLTEINRKQLTELKEIGELNAKNAALIGVTPPMYQKYLADLEYEKKLHEEIVKAQAAADAEHMATFANKIRQMEIVEASNMRSISGYQQQVAELERLDAQELAYTQSVYAQLTSEKDRMKLIEQYGAKHEEINAKIIIIENKRKDVVDAAMIAELEAQTKLNAAYGLTASGGIAQAETAYTKLIQALDALHLKKIEGVDQTAQENLLYKQYTDSLLATAKAQDVLRDKVAGTNAEHARTSPIVRGAVQAEEDLMQEGIDDMNRLLQEQQHFFDAAQKAADDARAKAEAAANAWRKMTYSMGAAGSRSDLEAQAAKIPGASVEIDSYGNPYVYVPGKNAAPSAYRAPGVTGFASGVENFAGGLALVGERGPELVNLPGGSDVIPNGRLGGGGGPSIIINITQPLGTPEAIARAVADAQVGLLRGQGVRLPYGT